MEKGNDGRERFANFVLPTLRHPTEVWATQYDDATLRHRYIKLFAGSKYDLLVVVRVEPNGSIFWNMMQRERKKMNDLRVGERLFGGTRTLGIKLHSRSGRGGLFSGGYWSSTNRFRSPCSARSDFTAACRLSTGDSNAHRHH